MMTSTEKINILGPENSAKAAGPEKLLQLAPIQQC